MYPAGGGRFGAVAAVLAISFALSGCVRHPDQLSIHVWNESDGPFQAEISVEYRSTSGQAFVDSRQVEVEAKHYVEVFEFRHLRGHGALTVTAVLSNATVITKTWPDWRPGEDENGYAFSVTNGGTTLIAGHHEA